MAKRQSIFVFFFFAIQAKATVIYIAPDPVTNESCIDTGHRLLPCYSIHQLNDSQTILSNKDEVTLFFFAGKHTILEHNNFRVFNTQTLVLLPYLWNKHKVLIECQLPAQIEFQDIRYLHISATTFVSCTLNLTRVLTPAYRQKLTITDCVFMNNGINYSIIAPHVHIKINHCTFHYSKGAINCLNETFVGYTNFKISINNTMFLRNVRESGLGTGSALNIRHVQIIVDRCQFVQNAAILGGAIYSEFSTIQVMNTFFINNIAQDSGGALYCLYTKLTIIDSQFYNNSARVSGGAIYFTGRRTNQENSWEDFILSNTNFTYNHAVDGGAIYCKGNTYEDIILGKIDISYSKFNSAASGGFAYLSMCQITKNGFEVSHNKAINGGAYYARESAIAFRGQFNNISYNTAKEKGGALFLQKSQIKLLYVAPQRIRFEYNTVTSANGKGGAIFVLDNSCETTTYSENQCFVYDYRYSANITLLTFTANKASQGSVLYGGLLDRCLPPPKFTRNNVFNVIQDFKRISDYEQEPLAISSEPTGVCLCVNDSQIDCSLNGLNFTKMRGESMKLSIAAIDQDENLVPSIITASYKEVLSAQLKQGERSTEISNRCTDLKYHIFTHLRTATLVLEPSENPLPLSNITIYIAIIPCSRGFEQQENTCVCDRRLANYFNVSICNVDTQSIQRVGSIWLKYDKNYLRIHANCPFDYCQIFVNNISLISPDDQCTNGRSGVLCGACQDNLSITLGGSRCLPCTSRLTAVWLIVVFALAGVALVALLLICNITISSGTLNGVIFYVNVVATSGLTNLHANVSIHPILSVFIAWLNLDLGVETCFYPGMDTYQKTWLQLPFHCMSGY